ncbi:hypothetical protein [Roseospirillum parvum]|uniref:Uncharacterized protein n=1 Tax=Roseospirillum parvum TaxID=83401 RepID=A0A1G7U5S7_9PROT|nr:hypothetical protein [Roseospirillum parvum]SDG42995.1 hypothetical protein SAMN05421742_101223 [Roseospirillum parvum]
MSRVHTTKTNFTGGEISPDLLGRAELTAFENGAAALRNVVVHPTGGVSRRPGLRHVGILPAGAEAGCRLIAFTFNTEQTYLLALSDQWLDVFMDGAWVHGFAVPWTAAQIPQVAWTQSADTLLVVHPEVAPRRITRSGHSAWSIEPWSFHADDDGIIHQPYHKFAAAEVTLAASATSGTVTLSASAEVFQAGHVGTRLRLATKEVLVTAVTSPTEATAEVRQTLSGTAATRDWEEQAFSTVRGWPVTVTFHQDRLVIGGARDLPNRLWLSKSADLFNFDLGEGLDDEAIDFAILSDAVNAIRGVFSGRHLQVLTTGAEWMVSGDPLTPTSIQLKRQTRVGSISGRYIPPRDIDGATLFCAASGREVREFLFTDVEQSYGAAELSLLARHLVFEPRDMDANPATRQLHLVRGDGALVTVANYRAEKVVAWSLSETEGCFLSVAVVDDVTWFLVLRQGTVRVECFDPALGLDGALSGSEATAKTAWSGLDHLEGLAVRVLGEGADLGLLPVEEGALELPYAVSEISAGLPYSHLIEPLPPTASGAGRGSPGLTVRLIRAVFRLKDTAGLKLDTGRGPRDVPFKRLGAAGVLDTAPPLFSGDVGVRALGWVRDGTKPLWRVSGDAPLPCTVLSVTTEMKVNV